MRELGTHEVQLDLDNVGAGLPLSTNEWGTRPGRLPGVDEYLARYPELHATWGFSTVVIEPVGAIAAGLLALPHEDPFDRMIIVQGRRLDARIVTCDEAIARNVPGCVW